MPQAMTNLILSNSIFSLLLSSNFEKLNLESLRFERIALQRYLYISFPFMLYRDQIQLCIVDQNNQMSTYFLCISKRKIAFLTRYEKIFTFELFKNVVPILGKIQPCCPFVSTFKDSKDFFEIMNLFHLLFFSHLNSSQSEHEPGKSFGPKHKTFTIENQCFRRTES